MILPPLLAAVLLVPVSAFAARYDPAAGRAALRAAATACHATMVDATGLPLEPEKVAAITKGVDESLRLAKVAADAVAALDAAAVRRSRNPSGKNTRPASPRRTRRWRRRKARCGRPRTPSRSWAKARSR